MPLKINPQHISCLSQHVRLKMKDSCLVKTRSHLCTRAIIWVVTGTKAGAVPERGLQAPELWHWNSSCSLVISWLLHPFLDRAYTFFGFNTELRPACPDIYHLTRDFGFFIPLAAFPVFSQAALHHCKPALKESPGTADSSRSPFSIYFHSSENQRTELCKYSSLLQCSTPLACETQHLYF